MNRNESELHIKQLENQLILARREINNLRQQLKSLNYIHRKECDEISMKLESWRCVNCRNNQEINDEGAVALPLPTSSPSPLSLITMTEIGVISTKFPEKRGTPRQPGICPNLTAKLIINNQIFTNPHHAVEGLQEFSHMWILFHFHKNDSTHVHAKISPPRLNGIRTGIFATRSPHRPSPIGLSLVRIDRIIGNIIYFSGVDMIDNTPVLDIKPYIPQYDNPVLINNHSLELNNENIIHSNNNEPIASTATNIDGIIENLNAIRVMDGEENNTRDHIVGASTTESTRASTERDELLYTRLNSRIGEREAPDGEEEEPPNIPTASSTTITNRNNLTEDHIRVPSWIDQPPVSTLTVNFKERALAQLQQLGAEGEEKKTIISNVLREDPRSVYLRQRWSGHCYVFRIAELYVSCKFNDVSHTVTVYQVFQNGAGGGECDN